MEIFSTTIHWDQCRGVTWKINCRTEKASELQLVAMTPEHTANPAEWENINTHGQTKPNQTKHGNVLQIQKTQPYTEILQLHNRVRKQVSTIFS